MNARVIIWLEDGDSFEVATVEGDTEAEFVENVVSALHRAADEIDYTKSVRS